MPIYLIGSPTTPSPCINVPHDLVWTEVARKMAARGFNRSKEDCKKRFKSVLHYYKYNYRQISTGKQYYCGSPLERHLNRLEAKAASGSSSAAESSFAGAGKARARPKAKAGERKKRRRSVGLAAPAGQSGAGVAPAGQSGAGAAAAPDALLALVCREMDWREQRILERVQNMLCRTSQRAARYEQQFHMAEGDGLGEGANQFGDGDNFFI